MYQVPLKFIRVSEDASICATRIVAMMSTESLQARRALKDERRAGTLVNAAGREQAKTAIFLDNGTVVASPLSIRRLMTAIDKANAKSPGQLVEKMHLKVYDVTGEVPPETLIDPPDPNDDDVEFEEEIE